MKIERRIEEKQRTFTNGNKTIRVLNTNKINQILNNTQQENNTLEVMNSDVHSPINLITKLKIAGRNIETQTTIPQQIHKAIAMPPKRSTHIVE